ncbi:MAG: hypothetical protein NZ954_02230 [Thermofilaceae archaeon]|nr:hypothetical protein [Thermofilaceae archaeon]MCX8180926.1 glycerophosphodiester phosphodiesterase family protein [Thermofilaceae archaeon]MDW8003491.1 glycerophosphodiester phosphodiesterase family protein [Thermofilaceae archaeon]
MEVESLYGKFFIVAHRGASGYEPENTIRAVQRALEIGVDAIEVDVRLSRDNVPVVIHDETVDRTTNGRGRVRDMTVEQLKMLDAGGDKVPLLEEVLQTVKGRAVLFIELKEVEASTPSLALVKEIDMLNEVLFISFHAEALTTVKSLEPNACTGLIYARPGENIVAAKKIGCKFVLPAFWLATGKAVAFAHRLHLLVVTWTVDQPDVAAQLKKLGVDGVTSNYPDLMMHLRA